MSPRQEALASASIPLVIAIGGLLKFGRFNWVIVLLGLLLAAFTFRSTYARAKNIAKYGKPPSSEFLSSLQKRR